MQARRAMPVLPDWAILICLSALPVIELRGGVPMGLWMGLPALQVGYMFIYIYIHIICLLIYNMVARRL